MKYKNSFILTVVLSGSLAIIFSILNNSLEVQNNSQKSTKKNLRNKDNQTIIENKGFIENNTNKEYKEITKENKEEFLFNNSKKNDNTTLNERHIIPIGISTDNRYSIPTLVFLTSLMENIGKNTKYDIYIMISADFKKEAKNRIDSFVPKYGENKIKITYIDMQKAFIDANTNGHISTAAYYRLYFPTMLPKIDKLIYSDVDVINFKDLTEMYNIELYKNSYFGAFLDNAENVKELEPFGIRAKAYFNSGILIMNLKALRRDRIVNKIQSFIKINNALLEHHDQTAINAVCYQKFQRIPIKFGMFSFKTYQDLENFNKIQDEEFRYSEKDINEAFHEPVMFHYAGYIKPWNKMTSYNKEYWWYYAKKSGFLKEIMEYYRYSTNDVEQLLSKIPNGPIIFDYKE